VGLQAIF